MNPHGSEPAINSSYLIGSTARITRVSVYTATHNSDTTEGRATMSSSATSQMRESRSQRRAGGM